MANKKIKFPLWLMPDTKATVECLYRQDGCNSQSEFIEKAILFYCGYLQSEYAGDCPEALRLLCCSSAGFSRTPAQRPVLWLPAGTRSAVSGKPHKPPTQARRRGTRCRLHLHLLRGSILLLQNLLTELI